jgi:phage shock protein PspC (stress-responsive transcriptional regulator)
MDTNTNGSEQRQAAYQQATQLHQDLDKLRRSTSDRYIAGVAGGLGRHFNVDPTVIRVLLAVLTLFGGAGVLIYCACWAFVPEDVKDKANISIGSEARKILLLAAAGIAFLLAMGDAFSGFNAGWPIATAAVVIAVVMIARDRRTERNAGSYPAPAPSALPTPAVPTAQIADPEQMDRTAETEATAEVLPPAWRPPVMSPPLLPPHPKRTGIIWFWPTLALIAIAMGVIGMVDRSNYVAAGVYPATAIAITGVMLLVGSFRGRAGGLILIGFVGTFFLAVATVLGTFNLSSHDLQANPTTSAAVNSEYSANLGRVYVDLTALSDPQNLAGRRIGFKLTAGQIHVIVPRGINLRINAAMGFAGGINIPGYEGGGFEDSSSKYIPAFPTTTTKPLVLDLDLRAGQIEVEQR